MAGAAAESNRQALYPIGLKIGGRRCLVVGRGQMARRKRKELLDCGAIVEAIDGPFLSSDLDGVHLVVAATDDRSVQEDVARAASARGIPCNVVDVNDLCTFYAPAVLRRGALTVTVATDGKFPLLAVALRDRIGTELGDAVAPALELLGEGRTLAVARFPHEPDKRVEALRRLLSPEALQLIVEGRLDAFREHWESWKVALHS
jgi:precorrin-2 dehydrogenase/sirohydrochlorin ferrochelatase